jgi:hypothetical protein
MIFSDLHIRGFRSIDPGGVTILFDSGHNACALVGSNNAGKSNVLDALALVLGIRNGKFYNYKLGPSDSYGGDTSVPLAIRLSLREPLVYRNVYQQIGSIDGFVLTAREYAKGANKGDVHVDHYCFGRNAKGDSQEPLIEPQRIYKKKSDANPDVENAALPLLAKDYAYRLGSAYFLDIQNLSTFFKVSGTGPLGKVFRFYRDDFEKDHSTYRYKDASGEKEMPSKDAFARAAARLGEILKTPKLREIEEKLAKNVSQSLGLPTTQGATFNLGIPDHQELFEEMLTLRVTESPALAPMEISKLGSGYLSLFRMATLQTLAELNGDSRGVYLIEEPEIYLHPHLREFFAGVISKLAARGGPDRIHNAFRRVRQPQKVPRNRPSSKGPNNIDAIESSSCRH